MHPLRGRDQEMALLLQAWAEACDGHPRFVRVSGEPGAGKTRLVHELYQSLRVGQGPCRSGDAYWPAIEANDGGLPHVAPTDLRRAPSGVTMPYFWWGLRCAPGNESVPESFAPFADGLAQLRFHLVALIQAKFRRSALRTAAVDSLVDLLGMIPVAGNAMAVVGFTRTVVDLARAERAARRLAGRSAVDMHELELESRKLEDTILGFLACLNDSADERLPTVPTVIVLDDAQWSDARSMAFLARALRLAVERGWRILMIATVRSAELTAQMAAPDLAGSLAPVSLWDLECAIGRGYPAGTCAKIDLPAELSRLEAAKVLEDHLPGASPGALGWIVDRCQGQPLYLVNFAGLIREQGWLDANGDLSAAALAFDNLPSQVAAVIDQRLGLLRRSDPALLAALRWGSIQGPRFCADLVASVSRIAEGWPAGRAMLALAKLRDVHALLKDAPDADLAPARYQFGHQLHFERVRAMACREEVALVEAVLCEILRGWLASGRLEHLPPEERLEALQFLFEGTVALAAGTTPEESEAWQQSAYRAGTLLVEALSASGRYREAEAHASKLQQTAMAPPPWLASDPSTRASVLAAVGKVYELRGMLADWLACCQARIDLLAESGAAEDRVDARIDAACALLEMGDTAAAIRMVELAREEAASRADHRRTGRASLVMARAHGAVAQYDEEIGLLEQARVAFQAVGDRVGAGDTILELANVACARSRYAEAREVYQDSIAEYRLGRRPDLEARALHRSSDVDYYLSDYETAMASLNAAREAYLRFGMDLDAARALGDIGDVLVHRGQLRGARDAYVHALEVVEPAGDLGAAVWLLWALADAHHALGDMGEARRLSLRAGAASGALGDPHRGASARLTEAEVLTTLGAYDDAMALAESCRTTFDALGDTESVGLALRCKADAASCLGLHDRAVQLAQSGVTIVAESGDEHSRAISLRHLGRILIRGGDLASARACLEEATTGCRQVGDAHTVAMAEVDLAEIAVRSGELAEAEALLRSSIAALDRIGDRLTHARAVLSLGRIAALRGDGETALSEFAAAAEMFRAAGVEARLPGEGSLAEATEEMGRLLRDQGRQAEADVALAEADAAWRTWSGGQRAR